MWWTALWSARSRSDGAHAEAGSASSLRSRRSAADLDIARWFDTYRLTGDGPRFQEDLRPIAATQIRTALRREEVQAVLQELLAARLTDAAEADVTRIRAAWDLSFARESSLTFAARYSDALFEYYDEKIGELVARLESSAAPALTLIREEAYSARLIAVLNAIERRTPRPSALRPDERTGEKLPGQLSAPFDRSARKA